MSLDLDRFRATIAQTLTELVEQSARASAARKPVELDQQSVGRLSRQDALQQQAMAMAQEQRRLREIPRLQAALGRIEAGIYGLCLNCEEEIPEARLQIDPANETCIACRAG